MKGTSTLIIGIFIILAVLGSAVFVTPQVLYGTSEQSTLGTFQKTQYDTIIVDSVIYYTVPKDIPISPKCEVIEVTFPDGNKWIARADAFSSPLYVGDIRSSSWSYTFRDSSTYTHPTGRYYVTAGIYSDCAKSSAISSITNTYFDVTSYSTQPMCTAPEGKCVGGLAYNCYGGVWSTSACAYDCSVTNNVASCVTKPIICGDGSCHPTEKDTCPEDCKPDEKIGSKDCIDNWVSIYSLNTMNSYSWLKVLDCKAGVCDPGSMFTEPSCNMNLASCKTDEDCVYPSYKCLFKDETSTDKVCKRESCSFDRDCDDGDWLTLDKCEGKKVLGVDTGLDKRCVNKDMTLTLFVTMIIFFLLAIIAIIVLYKR